MARLARAYKYMRQKNGLGNRMSESMKISSGTERLITIAVFFIFFTHISACMYVVIAAFEGDYKKSTWIFPEFNDLEDTETYVLAVYFIVTTVATVGYGDITCATSEERVFCIILMMVGVLAFTFISGALSSILSNYDTS